MCNTGPVAEEAPVGAIRGCSTHRPLLQTLYWLEHCDTSQKVVGSIPNDVIKFFNRLNPSRIAIAVALTQPLIEMNIKDLTWRKGRLARKADNVVASYQPIV